MLARIDPIASKLASHVWSDAHFTAWRGFDTCQREGRRVGVGGTMALFGSLATVRAQLAGCPSFDRTFAYVEEMLRPGSPAHQRMLAVPEGETERVELGDGVFALEQAYVAKPRAEGRWEAHRAYIDVQVIVTGDELMEVTDTSRLVVTEDRTPEKDVLFFAAYDEGSVLRMRAGELAVFYPIDAHKPSLAAGDPAALVRKTVVKVPVASVA